MDREQLRAKFRGALLGAAIGDALGAAYEGSGGIDRAQLEHLIDEPGPLQYTDDTHMTIGVAESLIERRGFDGAHMAERFARNFATEPWRGYGPGPPQVFHAIERGVPWDEAGRTLFGGAGSFGNGAAMRVTPVALFAFDDLALAAELARQTAIVTHTHELGIEGAVLQACAAAFLLTKEPAAPLDPFVMLDSLRALLHTSVFRAKLDHAISSLLPDGDRREVIRALGNSIEAHASVPTALYAFFRSPGSFSDALLFAISLGGDADTIASMTGALSGAHLGTEAIPTTWREGVEGAPQLVRLADALLEIAVPDHT